MKVNKRLIMITGAALLVGIALGRGCRPNTRHPTPDARTAKAAVKFWTCSMHPQIRQPGPGPCPICGMDLVPVSGDAGDVELGPRELRLSPQAEALADVEVAPVERRFVTNRIRLVGKVEYDETRLAYITAWVPGRLDRLYVDYTGVDVKKGDHLAYLYSPELLSAQEELIQAVETVRNLQQSENSLIQDRAVATVEASRGKLRLWGLNEEQIQAIEERKQPDDHITIYAPISGVVIHKNALEGEYVKTGSRIYTLADLSRVWVKLDAYESDLAWLHYGQEVEFSTEAYPGETFRGKIAFIDPILNPETRTVKVRVNVENPHGRLKPDMFVRAVVESQVARGGKVFAPELAGKWIGPMHPEIVKDEPGACDICGMPLVSAESLGYVLGQEEEAPLVIPVTAPLITGERAVVYVRDPDRKGVYEGREIALGPRAGEHYIVQSGLEEGELVVKQGNFKIDSAVQIMAKPSMMNPMGGGSTPEPEQGGHAPAAPATEEAPGAAPAMEIPSAFRDQVENLYKSYLALATCLAADDEDATAHAAEAVSSSLDAVDMNLVNGPAHQAWMKHQVALKKASEDLTSGDIEKIRSGFSTFSEELIETLKTFQPVTAAPVYVLKCPMALHGKGAHWLQSTKETRNPYFSGSMLTCGSVVEMIGGR